MYLCLLKFSMKFKLFRSKTSCYEKFPSVSDLNTVHRVSQCHLTHTHSCLCGTARKLRTCRTTVSPQNVEIQRWWSGFWLSQITSKSTKEQNKVQKTLPSRRQSENKKTAQSGGGWVLSLANVNKHLPAALFLHLKSLGNSIQHLKISLLRLLHQAMARFLTHKQPSVKPKMELLIKLILYRISCWLNWFSLTSGRKAW